ncbi:MAG: GNAT family N-acetyltransferase [Ignavibacteriales bacterium]
MIRLLTNADKGIIQEYIDRNHMETTFLFGNVEHYGIDNTDKTLFRCGDYYGYFDRQSLKGIIPFYNLGSCIPHFEDDKALPEIIDLVKNQKTFTYLIGVEKVIKPIYEAIKDYRTTKENNKSSYMLNNNFTPFTAQDTIIYDATTEERFIDFIAESDKDSHRDRAREEVISSITQKSPDEDFLLLEKEGKLVSQACIQAVTSRFNQIGAVFTLPEERGKGYAKTVVSELCERIIDRNKIPSLFVRKNNTPAVKAYQSLGFKHYMDYLFIVFEK